MNDYATRKKNIFDPKSTKPFELSRSKIEMFLQCPRCFYLDRRLGVAPPRTPPFYINEAVDILLKKEFDIYRKQQEPHPLVKESGLTLVPFAHQKLDEWRNPFSGIRHHHIKSNFIVFGGIDDVWIDSDKKLVIVDYKSTSKDEEVSIDAPWQKAYKNQLEIYQWLFRKNNFPVCDVAYFVYANGDRQRESFNKTIHFRMKLIPYTGISDWIDDALMRAHTCLVSETIPDKGKWCDLCKYRQAAGKSFQTHGSGER